MKKFYIAGIVKEEDGSGYSVYFPDIPNMAIGGETVEEALENAADCLIYTLRSMAEQNATIPNPSSMEEVKRRVKEERELDGLSCPEDTLYHYFTAPVLDMVPVRVNLTVPRAYLDEIDAKAKLCGFNRSSFMTHAAISYGK